DSDGTTSAIFDFITPPLKSANQSFNLVAMSDMQRDGSRPNIFNEVTHEGIIDYFQAQHGHDLPTDLGLILIPGDLVPTGNNYNQWQTGFFAPAHPLFAHVPVYPVLGNHENNAGFYFQYFDLPLNGTAGYEEHWWYKDYSNVRIIGLNSNGGYRIQEQLDWLEVTLDEACLDEDIDFVFAQLHHPYLSELWTPGETNYTGSVIALMEEFTSLCGKPSIHFFGHTHGYSRGQSKDHEHLWVNVATAGGAIDNWGEFPNADYEEFNKSIDEYGFVVVNVTAGSDPEFTLRRISRGDQDVSIDNEEQDVVTLKKTDVPPAQPFGLFPVNEEVSPNCVNLVGSIFDDAGDFHQASHWQVAEVCSDFSNPLIDQWKQHENWYNEVDTQAGDDLTDEKIEGLSPNSTYCWRVRYRDEHLKWSDWSAPIPFSTGLSELTDNLLLNGGGEDGVNHWIVETGSIESLGPGECAGGNPYRGDKYLAVGGLCDGNETTYSAAYQIVDVSSMAAVISGGEVEVNANAYLANYNGNDQPSFFVQYLDATDGLLGTSPTQSASTSTWTYFSISELLPAATRQIKIVLTGTRNAGTDNDSYFDELAIQLDTFPGDNCADLPLPVELLDFRGDCEEEELSFFWEVVQEVNLRQYRISKSRDGRNWQVLATRQPSRAENGNKQYRFRPQQSLDQVGLYFRLESIDWDGQVHYSPIIRIDCSEATSFQVYPNPVSADELTIVLESDQVVPIHLRITNALGQQLYQDQGFTQKGKQKWTVPIHLLPKGIYSVDLSTTTWQQRELFIRD
ncbi:MAG: metallophosphoesterase, partial [Bacteroidota bacterium]